MLLCILCVCTWVIYTIAIELVWHHSHNMTINSADRHHIWDIYMELFTINKGNLTTHMYVVHNGEISYICGTGLQLFAKEITLTTHIAGYTQCWVTVFMYNLL
jgi:hypothetical protein